MGQRKQRGSAKRGTGGKQTGSRMLSLPLVMISILFGNATHNIVDIVHDAQQICLGRFFTGFDLQLAGIV
jgi:hypothetical protein